MGSWLGSLRVGLRAGLWDELSVGLDAHTSPNLLVERHCVSMK